MDAPIIRLTVDEDELLHLSGYSSRGYLERWLRENRIKYFRGQGGRVFTTVGLLDAAKGLHRAQAHTEEPREEIFF